MATSIFLQESNEIEINVVITCSDVNVHSNINTASLLHSV